MNMPAMKFKVLEKYLEIGVVVEKGFALRIGDVDGENAVVVVGLDDASVIAKKSEFLVEFELMTDYGFEMGHDVSPLCEVPVGEQEAYKILLRLRLRQRPASIELAVLGAQGFHPGFVKREASDEEPEESKNDGFEESLMREDASDKEQASDEGDEVFHGGSFS